MEGDYIITDVKELDGSEEFLDLSDEDKGCQTKETVVDCKARKYLEAGRRNCSCIPFHLMSHSVTVR